MSVKCQQNARLRFFLQTNATPDRNPAGRIYAWISNSIYSRVPLDCIYSINSRGFHGISFSVGCTQVTLTHNQQAVCNTGYPRNVYIP